MTALIEELRRNPIRAPWTFGIGVVAVSAGVLMGWGLYILLTDRCAMVDEADFFRPQGGGKRKVLPK